MIFGGYEMSNLFDTLKTRLSGNTKRIVLPESHDERILKAASQLQEEGLVEPVLVGKKDQVEQKASELGINLDNVEVIKDRKSTRLNSSHVAISYAVFCL